MKYILLSKLALFSALMILFAVYLAGMTACSGSGEEATPPQTSGTVTFQLSLKQTNLTLTAVDSISRGAINCTSDGIVTVTAEVVDSFGNSLGTGRWPCAVGKGSINAIPVGTGYTVYVAGRDGSDQVLFSGEHSDVSVMAEQVTDLGTIELISMANNAPRVQITNPSDMSVFNQGQTLTLSGLAEDAGDGNLIGDALIWSSDIDGELGRGESLDGILLSTGHHTIDLTATDSHGGIGKDSIVLFINSLPVATIASPVDGYHRCVGLDVTFSGNGNDPEDGWLNSLSALTWLSNIDGPIGNGPSITLNDLSLGTHTITLSVSDSRDAIGKDIIQILIHPPLLADTGQTFSVGEAGGDGDYLINPPDFTDNGDGTVTDNLTGLLWQQRDDGTARPWYIASYEYVSLIAIGPYAQWRLPTKKELLRIADYGRTNPAINTDFFPGTKNACYWTDIDCNGQAEYYWAVDFATGRVFAAEDTTTCYIRAVTDIR